MAMTVDQFTCRSDNFGVLIHDPDSGLTAAIDAPEAGAIRQALARHDWKLDTILVTHHHADHTEGILPLKSEFGATVIGPVREIEKIPGVDRTVGGGDRFKFGNVDVEVLDTPGHTLGHITYSFAKDKLAFVGDTLFAIGCGRVIEGTYDMMWDSLARLMGLADDTSIYCGHEYTQANARFALTVDPDNTDLKRRAVLVDAMRASGKATLPTTMGLEKRTNPFLRVDDADIRKRLKLEKASQAEVFAEIRKRKDAFK